MARGLPLIRAVLDIHRTREARMKPFVYVVGLLVIVVAVFSMLERLQY